MLHPDERIHLRKLERLFGARSASLQRDLRELTELGALGRVPSSGGSRRVEYEIVPEWPLWSPFRQIIGALSDPVLLAREALRGITGVEAAFIYGSVAKRQACEDSDVDIFVVGESVDRPRLHRALAEVAILTGREVNPGIYTRQVLQERLVAPASPGHRFLRDVLAGPKIWIAGSREALLPMARAAGLVAFP